MKSTLCPNDKDEGSIPKQSYHIHDTEGDGNPEVGELQPWDPSQEKSDWETVTHVGGCCLSWHMKGFIQGVTACLP